MRNSLLLSRALILLQLLASSPLAGASSSYVSCNVNLIALGDTDDDSSRFRYAANSTYEANLRRLAAVVTAEAAASPGQFVDRAVGYWPNRAWAIARCESRDGADCAACIADAFKRVETRCPFGKDAYFYSRNCTLSFGEVRIFDHSFSGTGLKQMFASMLIFQAIGFACLLFLLLQEWRGRKKRHHDVMLSNPLLA